MDHAFFCKAKTPIASLAICVLMSFKVYYGAKLGCLGQAIYRSINEHEPVVALKYFPVERNITAFYEIRVLQRLLAYVNIFCQS